MGAALATLAAVAAWTWRTVPANATVTVSLRVEGATQTLYDGPVSTAPGLLDGRDGSGAHPCQGDHPGVPQATAAGALSSAGIGWQGSWFSDLQDFFVNRIGPDASQPPFAYWALLVNWRYALGACRAGLNDGDEVLWVYDTAQRPLILRLSGPTHVAPGVPFVVRVRDGWLRADGSDGGPVAGALVDDSSTGSDGQARLQLEQAGVFQLRATRGGAVPSNALTVCVGDASCGGSGGPPEVGPTTPTTDVTAPTSTNVEQQGQPRKGASNAKQAHRDARRCVGTRRTDGKRAGGRRHTGHRHRPRRGRNLHAAAPDDRHSRANRRHRRRALGRWDCSPKGSHRRGLGGVS